MAVPLTRVRRRELTREALLDAATTVFAHRGYVAGTLEEIAEAAGFTQGAIYSNFANKQELFLAVVERRNTRLLAAYLGAIRQRASDGSVDPAAITRVWTEHELNDAEALLLTLEIRLAALRDPTLRARLGEFERQTEQGLDHAREKLQRQQNHAEGDGRLRDPKRRVARYRGLPEER